MKSRHIGGSLLASSEPGIFEPMPAPFGTLQVIEVQEADTHALILLRENSVTLLATHPNGYSCHELAKRILAGNTDRAHKQADYITQCGGTCASPDLIDWCTTAKAGEC